MVKAFRGEFHQKVDAKGRVSIPASFRRVLEAGDPNWETGKLPEFVLVYGDEKRNFLECFTREEMARVDAKIAKQPRGSAKRRAMSRLYSGQSMDVTVDDTGRIVLSAKLRNKIGLEGEAFFIANTDTFEIWKPETFDAENDLNLAEDDDFDPNLDPSVYLDGDED
ncbi:division/cell wall cluster transcriptional repressor MraZ [Nereida sp. MMG025]|uniref:division/cell wall cluster transcriptional repressor MraZ n=1 Tax=Nereida sp. MMG025 TaxID=2909981 RepID=UPI001F431B97|nr:division/cell wall cluster transcriptional repressor MraZ [Nereida sp. MMG025]MCF6445221.1 division/cell wall cluster transcriptional repressor MraZ [Nereida sp. MMG025]